MDSQVTTQMSTLRNIDILHIEPTDVCQLACPLCARETDLAFDKNSHHHLSVEQVKSQFDKDFILGLEKMFMCGNYGDPAAGKHTLELYRYFRSINPTITLGMNSNGALQNISWWQQLAGIFSQSQDYVVFSIDGLEDTNHLYRRNCNWSKLIENARAFISAGGSAHWDMLIYQHNEHQVTACQQLAKEMGFTWFRAKVSKRPLVDSLKRPVFWANTAPKSGAIDCMALKENSIFVSADGKISPCCWLGEKGVEHTEFDKVMQSWASNSPNATCNSTCRKLTTDQSHNEFTNQWQLCVELNHT
jgi:hypothetical protein